MVKVTPIWGGTVLEAGCKRSTNKPLVETKKTQCTNQLHSKGLSVLCASSCFTYRATKKEKNIRGRDS